jgi:hypothetical protein
LKPKQMMNITTKTKWPDALLIVALALVAGGVRAQDQRSQQPTLADTVTVNDLAGEPDKHLGRVHLVGVVAVVSQGKGFVLVDKREYADCGLACITERGTKKIPVRWSGDAPKLEQTIRVAGILSRSEEGLSFVAQEIGIP